MSKKVCSKCHEIKVLSEYNVDNTKKDGRQSYCRDCSGKAVRAAQAGSEARRAYQREYARKRAAELRAKGAELAGKNALTNKEVNAILKMAK